MKVKLKDIKEMAKNNAIDITNSNKHKINDILKNEKYLTKIAISSGIYGINGAILQGAKSGKLYAITARNSNLFYFV